MKEIKYVGFYDVEKYKDEKRNISLAATNKMSYIAEAISSNDINVNIISPSWSTSRIGWFKSRVDNLENGVKVTLPCSYGTKNRIISSFRPCISLIWLLVYLLKNTKKDDHIIVYHSLTLMSVIAIAKKIRKFKLLLEVEEIYCDVVKESAKKKKAELDFFRIADGYIFSTELLNEKINDRNMPFVTIYGSYKVEHERGNKFEDNKIHVVYAGTFDPIKGGVLAAVESSRFLTDDYHMHIIGFGTECDKEIVVNRVNSLSKEIDAQITYDGLLTGEDYIEYIQKCDIGLSTQNPNLEYNDTSFPSKILSYMANGLRVVTVSIDVVNKSSINSYMYYYEKQSAQSIAEAIRKVDMRTVQDNRKVIIELNLEFRALIKELIR